MPTIELICLGCETIPDIPTFSTFGWLAETKLQSHRGIFQDVFDASQGVIVHLVNKMENESDEPDFFVGRLIEWGEGTLTIPVFDPELGEEQWGGEDQDFDFQFLPGVVRELRHLLDLLLKCSLLGQVYFSTDYQFGPGEATQRSGYTLSHFFEEHDRVGLRFNCLYHLAQV